MKTLPEQPHIVCSVERMFSSTAARATESAVRTVYRNRIRFPNGWSVSWIGGLTHLDAPAGIYCEGLQQEKESYGGGDMHRAVFATVEVAIFNPQDDLVEFESGDTVKDNCPPAKLLEILNWAAAQKG
jgi:hypothetical protein